MLKPNFDQKNLAEKNYLNFYKTLTVAGVDDESKALFNPDRRGSCRGLEVDGPATGEVGGGGGGVASATAPDEDLGRGGSDEDFGARGDSVD